MGKFILCAVFFALSLAPGILYAASFDCSRAATSLEVLICGDANLSSLDEQVGTAYSKVHSAVAAGSDESAQILSEQREFLEKRTDICPVSNHARRSNLTAEEYNHITTCLDGFYTLRLNALQKQLAASGSQNSQPDNTVNNPFIQGTNTILYEREVAPGQDISVSN